MANRVDVVNTMANRNYKSAMDKAIFGALDQAGIIIEGRAISRAPVDTGRLKGSITWASRRHEADPKGKANRGDGVSTPGDDYTAHVGTNVEYAQWVEYGTGRMTEQPYLRPAIDESRDEILRDFEGWVRKGLRGHK